VRILDSNLYDSVSNMDPRAELVLADIRDSGTVADALQDVWAVVHLAAIVGDPACALDPARAVAVNETATSALVNLTRGAGVSRFVLASTCSVYGAGQDEELTEESAVNPVSLYAETKLAAERIALAANLDAMTSTVLRFSTLYGLALRLRFDLVVNLLTARAARGLPISVFGGSQWRPCLHVKDAAHAIVQTLSTEPSMSAGLFNVGKSDANYQLADVGRLVAAAIPETQLIFDTTSADQRTYRVSFAKFTSATGFQPTRNLDEGIRELAEHLQAHPQISISARRWNNASFLEQRSFAAD
jgi:nucleoside-diphosphate-sugar epimerase